ncbi:MAG: hypothetical protein ABFD98_16335 [Syntrophobacteraceae bacterium]
MRRLFPALLAITLVFGVTGTSLAASTQALKERSSNSLVEFTPPESFLSGNFVGDEVEPTYVFGKVRDFVKSRSGPTAWFIEEGEKKRIESHKAESGPLEYTLYLEEDSPGKTFYYVFVDRSQANSAQWLEWRKQFHKSKAQGQYAAALAVFEQAALNGYTVDGELRFIEENGELHLKKPEIFLLEDLKFRPIYDLQAGKAVER